MKNKAIFSAEGFGTTLAGEGLFSVQFLMKNQVGFLCKAYLTDGADKRLFTSVQALVIN